MLERNSGMYKHLLKYMYITTYITTSYKLSIYSAPPWKLVESPGNSSRGTVLYISLSTIPPGFHIYSALRPNRINNFPRFRLFRYFPHTLPRA